MTTRIHADVAKNTLYLILDGFFGDAEIKNAVATTYTEAKKLKAGFSVINDVTGFKPTDPKAGSEIGNTQSELRQARNETRRARRRGERGRSDTVRPGR